MSGEAPRLIAAAPNPQRQRGTLLLFCLIFLTVLALLAVAAMDATTMEQLMAANGSDRAAAFNGAESALRAAEEWLAQQTAAPVAGIDGGTGVWVMNGPDPDLADGRNWWDHADIDGAWWVANGVATETVVEGAPPPRYLIEQYRMVDSGESIEVADGETAAARYFYRITSIGVAVNPAARALVQSLFARGYDPAPAP